MKQCDEVCLPIYLCFLPLSPAYSLKDLLIQGHSDVDSQDKARGFRTTLRPRMGAGRNIGGGPGGEAPRSKWVLGDLTGIFTHLQGLKIIISLVKKLHRILSFRKLY